LDREKTPNQQATSPPEAKHPKWRETGHFVGIGHFVGQTTPAKDLLRSADSGSGSFSFRLLHSPFWIFNAQLVDYQRLTYYQPRAHRPFSNQITNTQHKTWLQVLKSSTFLKKVHKKSRKNLKKA
jgi:hypothetical protein